MSNPFIAEIRLFPYTFAPRNWAWCEGQLQNVSQNSALFSLIGCSFGGNCQTNFALPNLVGRAVMGAGSGPGLTPRSYAQSIGTNSVTLTEANLPVHDHSAKVIAAAGNDHTPSTSEYPGAMIRPGVGPIKAFAAVNGSNMETMASQSMATAGQSVPHENRQPALGMNFCIALYGIYPPRN